MPCQHFPYCIHQRFVYKEHTFCPDTEELTSLRKLVILLGRQELQLYTILPGGEGGGAQKMIKVTESCQENSFLNSL